MFRVRRPTASEKTFRVAIAGLLAFSVAAFAITFWVMVDFLKEQQIVQELIENLPPESAAKAETLAGELRWQFRLSILVVLNMVVTAFAMALLWRAYRSSQESLRDVKALAADILSSMDQAVITTDLGGLVTSINQRGMDMFGVTQTHVGRPLEDLSATLPLREIRQKSAADRSQPFSEDFPVTENGATSTLRAFCQPLQNGDATDIGYVIQLQDVTERVLIKERMLRMERYMGLGSLAAGLHHEIKNPLAALSLHVQLLEEHLDQPTTSGDVHDMLRVIRSEVTRVGGVLESFRDFASLEQLNEESIDVGVLVERQAKLIAPRAESLGIDVRVNLPPSLPRLNADPVRLEQVILNLLVNAMDAMPDGGCLTVGASKSKNSEAIQVHVIDTGGGIPERLRENVFDPYFTTKSEGTGMGLALCDKIVRQHNGTMECHSSSEGTVFEITIPIQQAHPERCATT